MKIAFQNLAWGTWFAGGAFLEGVFAALSQLGSAAPQTCLVVSPRTPAADFEHLASFVDEVVVAPDPPPPPPDPRIALGNSLRTHLTWWLRRQIWPRTKAFPRPSPLAQTLEAARADCFFRVAWGEATPAGRPTLAWVYDFQHHHLPHLLAPAEREARDAEIRAHSEAAAAIVTTSDAVRQDLAAFLPHLSQRAHIIRYAAAIPAAALAGDPRAALAPYHLPEKFIYLPNRFWAHKQHVLVIEALAQLKTRGMRPTVVCTGSLHDSRDPEHASGLAQALSLHNVRDQMIWLGSVPRLHVYALMRQAAFVLNASQFEGLGLSLAEAHALGKRALVSDLAVLREQEAPGVTYFRTNDAADLAAHMAELWDSAPAGPDREMEAAAQADQPARLREFGESFLRAAQAAISLSGH